MSLVCFLVLARRRPPLGPILERRNVMTNGEHKDVRPQTEVKDPPKATEKKTQAAAETVAQKDSNTGATD